MQFSVTTKGMEGARVRWRGHFSGLCASCGRMPLQERLQPRALWMRSGEWKSSRLKLLLQGRHRVGLECGEPEKAKARALRAALPHTVPFPRSRGKGDRVGGRRPGCIDEPLRALAKGPTSIWRSLKDSNRCFSLERVTSCASRREARRVGW